MVGVPDGLPEGAALIDGEDDETVGLVEGPATRDGLSEGLEDEITDTLGVLLGSPLGRAEALKDGEAFGAVEVVGAAKLIEGVELGLSSTETGSWKAMLGIPDKLPEVAALFD